MIVIDLQIEAQGLHFMLPAKRAREILEVLRLHAEYNDAKVKGRQYEISRHSNSSRRRFGKSF